jgi:hypothetical protein
MSSGVVETGVASAGGSFIGYMALKMIRKSFDKTKIRGLVLLKGKTYCEKHFGNEDCIFFDLDGAISNNKLTDFEENEKKLNLYPVAKDLFKKLKSDWRNKTLIICSLDYNLLRYLKIKEKNINVILPSAQMMLENKDAPLNTKNNDNLEKIRLTLGLKTPKKQQHIVDNFQEQSDIIKSLFKLQDKIL